MERLGDMMKSNQQRQTSSTQEENSKVRSNVKNSEALKLGKTRDKHEIKKCQFCNKDLEVVGTLIESRFFNTWMSKGDYERCACKEAKKYWENFDAEIIRKKEAEEKAEAERIYNEKITRLMRKSNLGERFKNRTFSTYEINKSNKEAYEMCKSYADKFPEVRKKGLGIILNGSYGAGKTHLVAAVAHEIIRQGYQPIFGTLINLLDRIRATYEEDKVTEQQIINSYINCDLLIIDDVGKEKITEWALQKLYQIINARYEDNKPVLLTSNYSMEKLTERLTINDNFETAEAIVSRIYEMCQGLNLKCDDYRKK